MTDTVTTLAHDGCVRWTLPTKTVEYILEAMPNGDGYWDARGWPSSGATGGSDLKRERALHARISRLQSRLGPPPVSGIAIQRVGSDGYELKLRPYAD